MFFKIIYFFIFNENFLLVDVRVNRFRLSLMDKIQYF